MSLCIRHVSSTASGCRHDPWSPSAQSPFARFGCYPRLGVLNGPPRRALPLLHRSYGLTRQSIHLLTFSALAYTPGLRRLLPAPAGAWTFPTLSPQSLQRRLDPYPAVSLRCSYPFLPEGHRPHLRSERFGTTEFLLHCSFSRSRISGLQSFLHVQAPLLARPPDCSHRTSFEMGGRAVYTTHRSCSYPS